MQTLQKYLEILQTTVDLYNYCFGMQSRNIDLDFEVFRVVDIRILHNPL